MVCGSVVALPALAARVNDRYAQAFPDEQERYTPEWREWCTHDNQHVLGWALDAQRGLIDVWEQIAWLAGVLAARDYALSTGSPSASSWARRCWTSSLVLGPPVRQELRGAAGILAGYQASM